MGIYISVMPLGGAFFFFFFLSLLRAFFVCFMVGVVVGCWFFSFGQTVQRRVFFMPGISKLPATHAAFVSHPTLIKKSLVAKLVLNDCIRP